MLDEWIKDKLLVKVPKKDLGTMKKMWGRREQKQRKGERLEMSRDLSIFVAKRVWGGRIKAEPERRGKQRKQELEWGEGLWAGWLMMSCAQS